MCQLQIGHCPGINTFNSHSKHLSWILLSPHHKRGNSGPERRNNLKLHSEKVAEPVLKAKGLVLQAVLLVNHALKAPPEILTSFSSSTLKEGSQATSKQLPGDNWGLTTSTCAQIFLSGAPTRGRLPSQIAFCSHPLVAFALKIYIPF